MIKHIVAYEGLVKVSLGLMQEEYIPLYLPWVNKRIGIEGTLQGPPYSLEYGLEWVRSLDKKKSTDAVFAVLLHSEKKKSSMQYIGHMGIHKITWPHGFAETGSIIGHSNGQGRGCGTEAKLLLQYHAFMVLGLRKLTSSVKAWNSQSLGHLIKCGYQIVGRRRAHHFHEGAYVDEILLEVFREEWQLVWDKYQKTKELPKLSSKQRDLVAKETGK